MAKIIVSFLLTAQFAFAAGSQIQFQNGASFFRIEKSRNRFIVDDPLGARSLEIKPCNEKLINAFWNGITEKIEHLQKQKSIEPGKQEKAWIQFEGLRYEVLDIEPAFPYFLKVSNNFHVLFSESAQACKE